MLLLSIYTEISRRTGYHRKTIHKMLRYSQPPGYQRTEPVNKPKIGPFFAPSVDLSSLLRHRNTAGGSFEIKSENPTYIKKQATGEYNTQYGNADLHFFYHRVRSFGNNRNICIWIILYIIINCALSTLLSFNRSENRSN